MKHPLTEQNENERATQMVLLAEVLDIIKNVFTDQMETQNNRSEVEQIINGNICNVVESELKKQIKHLKKIKL